MAEFGLAFWECPAPMMGFAYCKARGNNYGEPNLCRSQSIRMGGLGFCSLVVLALAFLCVASQLLHMRTPCSSRRGDSQIRCGKECKDLMWLSSSVSFRLFVLVFLLPNFPRCQQQQQSSRFLCIRMMLL